MNAPEVTSSDLIKAGYLPVGPGLRLSSDGMRWLSDEQAVAELTELLTEREQDDAAPE